MNIKKEISVEKIFSENFEFFVVCSFFCERKKGNMEQD